ncbi:MAG: choice-of-anchor D domain-containing protein [Calothrix sp. C42_A2020_038]|nr:choice-of-anchor D domain-containing protein [Calothrix sp. C42_A2020_038]
MIQLHTEELAKQGDVNAIEALINELLKPKGVKAKVGLKNSCLYIALASAQIPEKQALVRCIGKQILKLGIKSLQSAKIYAAQWGQQLPVWQQEIPLSLIRSDFHNHAPSVKVPKNLQPTSKQLTTGKHAIQLSPNGIIVSPNNKEQVKLQLRSQPIFSLPHPFPNLIGRLPQIKSALASIEAKQSVEFYGSSGLGKSALLRHLIYFIQKNTAFTNGTVWLSNPYQSKDDLLQQLFEVFYESSVLYKPTYSEICRCLKDKKLLVFVDNTNLTPEDVKHLKSILPSSIFIIAASSQKLFEGSSTQLLMLTKRDAVAFITQRLDQSIVSTDELIAIEALADLLSGHPYTMQLAVNCINRNVCSLRELILKLQPPATSQVLIEQVLEVLPPSYQQILAVLATVDGIGLSEAQIAALSEVENVSEILNSLLNWNLVDTEFNRYYISKTLVLVLQQKFDLTPFYERALSDFTVWREQSTVSNLIYPDALIPILAWANVTERWQSLLNLVKAVEGILFLSKRWGLWKQVLKYGLQASLALQDKQSEAWILHQLGSIALCLDDMTGEAHKNLTRALSIRESLGLEDAVAATRQNLNLVNISLAELDDITQFRVNYTSTNTKLQFLAVALIPLLCSVIAGLLAWYVISHLITLPAPNGADNQAEFQNVSTHISSNDLDFGKQQVNTERESETITITNDSSVSVRIGEIEKSENQGDFEISKTTCASAIAPRQSCDISIMFAPIEIGEHSASLSVTDNNGKLLQQILIKGVAVSPQNPSQDIPTAPKRDIQLPLPLSKPKLISPQTPQIVINQPNQPRLSTPPTPTPVKTPELPTESPEAITTEPTPATTQFPDAEPTVEPNPEFIQTPARVPDNGN